MKLIKNELPPLNTYVVVHYTGGNWGDKDDQVGVNWKVAKRTSVKQEGNHRVPYRFETFGALKLFGHEVDAWDFLPGADDAQS